MNFSARKLPATAAEELRICPITTVAPFALMLAPVYVFMRINAKFVSIKAPLDFFTPEEIEKLKPFESFFLPEFVEATVPFRDAGRRIRAILNWVPSDPQTMPPTSYEVSDAVLRILGPLWAFLSPVEKRTVVIEPFFTAIFTNDFCDVLPITLLKQAREVDLESFECALLRSSWSVFLALHLGYNDWNYLSALRLHIFERTIQSKVGNSITGFQASQEIEELIRLVADSVQNSTTPTLVSDWFAARPERVAQKIASRIERVKAQMIKPGQPPASLFGVRGIVHE